MIDRSYLPYRSARNYVDRKMAKWMGFFLSEHQTALNDENLSMDVSSGLSWKEKFTMISQAYIGQIPLRISIKVGKQRQVISGDILEIGDHWLIVRGKDQGYRIEIENILDISLEEGMEDVGP